jgi:hypothetical protein
MPAALFPESPSSEPESPSGATRFVLVLAGWAAAGEAGQGEVGEHAASEPTVDVAAGQEQRAQQSVGLRRAAGGEVLAGDEQDAQGVPVAALGAVSRVVWTLTRGGQRLLRWRRLRWRRLRRQR